MLLAMALVAGVMAPGGGWAVSARTESILRTIL